MKRRDRAYYHGVMFKAPGVQETAAYHFQTHVLLIANFDFGVEELETTPSSSRSSCSARRRFLGRVEGAIRSSFPVDLGAIGLPILHALGRSGVGGTGQFPAIASTRRPLASVVDPLFHTGFFTRPCTQPSCGASDTVLDVRPFGRKWKLPRTPANGRPMVGAAFGEGERSLDSASSPTDG